MKHACYCFSPPKLPRLANGTKTNPPYLTIEKGERGWARGASDPAVKEGTNQGTYGLETTPLVPLETLTGLRPTTPFLPPLAPFSLGNMRETTKMIFLVLAVVARARCTLVRSQAVLLCLVFLVMHQFTKVFTCVRRGRPVTRRCGCGTSYFRLSLSLVDLCFHVPRTVAHSPLYLWRSVRLRDGSRAEPRGGRGDGPSRLGGCFSRVSAACRPLSERAVRRQTERVVCLPTFELLKCTR